MAQFLPILSGLASIRATGSRWAIHDPLRTWPIPRPGLGGLNRPATFYFI